MKHALFFRKSFIRRKQKKKRGFHRCVTMQEAREKFAIYHRLPSVGFFLWPLRTSGCFGVTQPWTWPRCAAHGCLSWGFPLLLFRCEQSDMGLLWGFTAWEELLSPTLYTPPRYLWRVTPRCLTVSQQRSRPRRCTSQHLQVSTESEPDWRHRFWRKHYSNAPSLLNYTSTRSDIIILARYGEEVHFSKAR